MATYCEWSSYGSMLQAYALQRTLKSLGFESDIVYDTPAPAPRYNFFRARINGVRQFVSNFYKLLHAKAIQRRYKKTQTFLRENISLKYYDSFDVLKKHLPQYDCYLAGSDQIWHPSLCKPLFFLDFLPPPQKKYSYAASMGRLDIPEKNKETFSRMLNSFSRISARESDMAEILRQYTSKNVEVHIDPTFLLPAEEWRKIETPYPVKKPYILLYAIYWNSDLNREVKRLHRKTGLPVISVCGGLSKAYANKKIFDVSTEEFLWLVDHAEAVITSSFHGVAFSLIFNKKVATVTNPLLPSRIQSLYGVLGAESVCIADVPTHTFDYETVNKRMIEERERARRYLDEVLNEE